MTDVFLCYSRRDLEFVRSLAEALRERAADTFLDLGEWWYDDASREQSANSGDVSAVGLPDRALSHPASDSAVASANKTGLEAGYEPNAGARMDEVHAAIRGATSVLAVVSPRPGRLREVPSRDRAGGRAAQAHRRGKRAADPVGEPASAAAAM